MDTFEILKKPFDEAGWELLEVVSFDSSKSHLNDDVIIRIEVRATRPGGFLNWANEEIKRASLNKK